MAPAGERRDTGSATPRCSPRGRSFTATCPPAAGRPFGGSKSGAVPSIIYANEAAGYHKFLWYTSANLLDFV